GCSSSSSTSGIWSAWRAFSRSFWNASASAYGTQPARAQSKVALLFTPFLEPGFHAAEEARSLRAVDHPVVERQAQVSGRSNRDRVPFRSLHDDRALHDRLEIEDRHLRLVDDRRREHGAELAGVGDREGATLDVLER